MGEYLEPLLVGALSAGVAWLVWRMLVGLADALGWILERLNIGNNPPRNARAGVRNG